MIEISNLTKKYGNKLAVNGISFTVKKGEILGFLGPNGAGKSTTMNIITGYLSSTGGSVKVDGFDILDNPDEVKKRIGYLPEQPPLYLDMTVIDYLNFVFDLKKVKGNKKEHIKKIADLVKIDNVIQRKIQNLSKGYRQRVGLAQALVGDPEVLILDEPTVGLDPKQIIEIRNVIKDLGKDRTVILSSHILPEISAICERVIIIHDGVLVAEGNPESLSKDMGSSTRLQIRIAGDKNGAEKALKDVDGIRKISKLGQKEVGTNDFIIESVPGKDIRKQLFSVLAQRSLPIMMLKSMDLSLEDIFLQVTGSIDAPSVDPSSMFAEDPNHMTVDMDETIAVKEIDTSEEKAKQGDEI